MRCALEIAVVLVAAVAPQLSIAQKGPPTIQDNSFLIEEAYNQERGVVQHINTFMYLADSHDWLYTFTQEWPMPHDEKQQLSYTLMVVRPGDVGRAGFGDTTLNYRYQLVGNGKSRVAFAPRLSVIFPTGDSRLEHGFGATGIQTNLPLSVVLNRKLVTHWNAGATFVPNAQGPAGNRASTSAYNLGQSFIWLIHPQVNLMLETVFSSAQEVVGKDRTIWENTFLLSPGIRWAYNFKNGLQIVPGIAVPVGLGPRAGEKGVFLYLSFEHPFERLDR
jgi:hypothetical protein